MGKKKDVKKHIWTFTSRYKSNRLSSFALPIVTAKNKILICFWSPFSTLLFFHASEHFSYFAGLFYLFLLLFPYLFQSSLTAHSLMSCLPISVTNSSDNYASTKTTRWYFVVAVVVVVVTVVFAFAYIYH